MAWYPGATKMELQPESDSQPAIKPTQYILHSIAAPWTPERTYEYWHDSTNLESHFAVGYDGSLAQFIGTETRADANASANRRADGTGAVSIETESNLDHTDPWTTEQLYKLIDVGVWLHNTHGIPVRVPSRWDEPGMGFHSMFKEWSGGGTECPGDARREQFHKEILPEIARHTSTPQAPKPQPIYAAFPGRSFFHIGQVHPLITKMGERLVAEGCSRYRVGPSPDFGPADIKSYAAWQRKLGYSGSDADGYPGPASWAALKVPRP